jgi:hypothetical protein
MDDVVGFAAVRGKAFPRRFAGRSVEDAGACKQEEVTGTMIGP